MEAPVKTREIAAHDWPAMVGKIRERWYSLTDEDISRVNGNYKMLVSALQTRYMYSRATAEQDVESFLNEFAMSQEKIHA